MDMLTTAKPRAKWGVRSTTPAPIVLTPRDLNLLAHVATLRFLTPEQVGTLIGGSEQKLIRRCRALFDLGYLDQVGDPFGTKAYGLTRKGARLLNEHGHLVDATLKWTLKNRRAGARFIEHTIEIAGVLGRLHVACRARRDVRFMLEHEIITIAPEATQKAREPLRWTAPGAKAKYGVSSVVSDGLFGLRFPDDTESYFLLEIDRGTMPNLRMRGKLEQTSIGRKLAIYLDGWRANRQMAQFGVKQLRVAIVTTSTARVANMIDVVKQMTGGAGSSFFLFIDRNRLVSGDPLEAEWVSGRGEAVKLID